VVWVTQSENSSTQLVSSFPGHKKVGIIARFPQVAWQIHKPAPTFGCYYLLQYSAFGLHRSCKWGRLRQLRFEVTPENGGKSGTTGISGSIHQGVVVDKKMMSCFFTVSSGSHNAFSCT
jgi:hypothetical protein